MEVNDVNAASSPASVSVTSLNAEQRTNWLKTGELPSTEVKPKADSAPASKESSATDTSAETGESGEVEITAPDSEPGKNTQEQPRKRDNAETRIKELLAKVKLLESEKQAKEAAPAESSTAKPETKPQPPSTYQDWRKEFKPREWVENYAKEHPEDSYEDAQAAMSDHLDEVRSGFRQHEQQVATQRKAFEEQMSKVSERYPDAKEKITATGKELYSIHKESPMVVEMINNSPVFHDLLYVIGGDAEKLTKFIETAKSNPLQAVREVAVLENLIMKDLDGQGEKAKETPERGEDGKFVAADKAPEKKVTSAPPIGKEVGTKNTAPPDEYEAAMQRGDMATVRKLDNKRDLERLRLGTR
jgi:hypothetical protein